MLTDALAVPHPFFGGGGLFCFVFCAPVTLLEWRWSSVTAVFHFSLSICSPYRSWETLIRIPFFVILCNDTWCPFCFCFIVKTLKIKCSKNHQSFTDFLGYCTCCSPLAANYRCGSLQQRCELRPKNLS